MISQQVQDRAVDIAAATPAAIAVGMNIVRVNEYLQAGAYIVAIISGLCATYYYIRKAHSKGSE